MSEPVFDDEFGLCMDPCEHPSLLGDECMACGERVPPVASTRGLPKKANP